METKKKKNKKKNKKKKNKKKNKTARLRRSLILRTCMRKMTGSVVVKCKSPFSAIRVFCLAKDVVIVCGL
jgi:hypothetical protein